MVSEFNIRFKLFPYSFIHASTGNPYHIALLSEEAFEIKGRWDPSTNPAFQRGALWAYITSRKLHVFVVHLHAHLLPTADLYAIPYLNISSEDVVFSAAKLFFAYGLGNALTFPMAVGATSILLPGPPDPKSVVTIFTKFQPTLFFGVPTLFAMLLADKLPEQNKHSIRLSVSAGEPLPADLLHRWKAKVGTEILDGIGTTEMLHIFVSNEIDDG